MRIRLSKFLAQAGVGSRRLCDKLILEKKVTVNGSTACSPYLQVDDKDKIYLNNTPLNLQKKIFYIMLNKPKGYVCSHKRRNNEKLIYDLISDAPKRLFSLGRLDKNTQGLILLTNDGAFAQKVIHPSYNVSKEYLVKTSFDISHLHLKALSEGCSIEGKKVVPKKVIKVRKGTLKIVVSDGLKHEVRKLVAHAGLDVLELKRIRIGGLRLDTLPEGHYRFLQENHLKQIFH